MSLYHLIYSSTPTRNLSDQELQDLLDVARAANAQNEVTGMLVCFDTMYLQLIEGKEDKIKQLYQNLLRDARHYNVQTLREGPVNDRFFPDWSMGFEKKETNLETKEASFEVFTEKSITLLSIIDSGISSK
ncbi:BLUF domain-containing protein [Desertivirga arenae]|uniref:BLUF domain-containing protein n=1 Tax=Desertivirga arenae TaxID=2810309 RepID=UPI001A96DC47|nr:BLUF domain-containing protein [Pedobacter sp. SYSU D00823]